MSFVYLVVLAVVQGITEFLPISSSAHLILAPSVLGQADQGPLIDVMAHAGSLVAVLVYFWRDILNVAQGKLALLTGKITPGGRLALLVAASMPPVFIVAGGLYAFDLVDALRSPAVIAVSTLVFALPLWLADRYGRQTVEIETMSFKQAVLIGVAQLFALIPGASRSGVTMTAGRALGLKRSESARFSMLMAIPVIAAFGLVSGLELARGSDAGASLTDGLVVAFLSFVIYRVALGVGLIIMLTL